MTSASGDSAPGSMYDIAQRASLLNDAGYVGVQLDHAAGAMTLYWHGAPPTAVRELVQQAASAGVTVHLSPVAWSRQDAVALRDRVLADSSLRNRYSIRGGAVAPDGTVTILTRDFDSSIAAALRRVLPGPIPIAVRAADPRPGPRSP